jgi:hypothetical protein
LLIVHDVVEAEFVNTLGGRHDAEPVTELLLLEVFLGPALVLVAIIISLERAKTDRYLRYRPENSWLAMTSIFPSPCWLMVMVSPRLPVRPPTLMRSWRNFSYCDRSKILSLTGWDALMINFFVTFWPLLPFLELVFYKQKINPSAYCSQASPSSLESMQSGNGQQSERHTDTAMLDCVQDAKKWISCVTSSGVGLLWRWS